MSSTPATADDGPATLERILQVLGLLQSRPVWSGPELAAATGVTTRTVRRDVERLRQLGYPVRAEHGTGGGYQLGPGRRLPPLLLDDEEAIAVVVALQLASGPAVEGLGEAAVRALGKLDQVLPSRLRTVVEDISQATISLDTTGQATRTTVRNEPDDGTDPAATPVPAWERGSVTLRPLLEIARAVQGHQRVTFDYTKRGAADPGSRRVEPYRMVCTGRRWYLMAWDVDRGDWRSFRLDRMRHVHRTGWRFTPRPAPDPAEFIERALRSGAYPVTARVRVSLPAATARGHLPGAIATVHDDGLGRCIIETGLQAAHTAEDWPAARWLLAHLAAFGVPVEVLAPAELRAAADRVGRLFTPPSD